MRLRPTRAGDLAWVTALERDPANRSLIGQWTDAEHAAAIAGEAGREHWIIERDGARAGYLIAYDARAQGLGLYVKRLLVEEKERGTGKAALALFLEDAFGSRASPAVWLHVREANTRAQAVYRRLEFVVLDASSEEHARLDAAGEPLYPRVLRMRLANPR